MNPQKLQRLEGIELEAKEVFDTIVRYPQHLSINGEIILKIVDSGDAGASELRRILMFFGNARPDMLWLCHELRNRIAS